jgi:hypothetical protein
MRDIRDYTRNIFHNINPLPWIDPELQMRVVGYELCRHLHVGGVAEHYPVGRSGPRITPTILEF